MNNHIKKETDNKQKYSLYLPQIVKDKISNHQKDINTLRNKRKELTQHTKQILEDHETNKLIDKYDEIMTERQKQIPKNFIILFLKQYSKSHNLYMKNNIDNIYKNIIYNDNKCNEILIDIIMPEDSDISYFEIFMEFDKYNDINILINTNEIFKNSLFYQEVIKTNRYKEAWQIIKQKYTQKDWIDKYIYFILNATPIIEILIK